MKYAVVLILFLLSSQFLYADTQKSSDESVLHTEDEYYLEGFEALLRLDQDMQTVIRFINTEQAKLHQTRKLLSDLQVQKNKLAVLVKADQEIVDSLFEYQEQKKQDEIWSVRSESFILGFFSSLAVVLVVYVFNQFRLKRNET